MNSSVRKFLYAALVIACSAFAGFIFLNGKSKIIFPELKERQGALAQAPEWPATQARVKALLTDLKAHPNDTKTKLKLAKEFMQESRVTGDYSYYNKTALDLIDEVLASDAKNFEAKCLKAMIFLSQHRFEEARALAEKACEENPYNAFVFGLLTDAYVELGDYDKAVATADKMVNIRPDIRSYSRVSYLREIFGQSDKAIEAIQMAVSAGYPGNEDTEWSRMVLAHLFEDNNQLDKAEEQYQTALQERPDYPFALAGLGRIAAYHQNYPAAVQYFEKARNVMSDIGLLEELTDLYRLNNQPDKAAECARISIDALLADNITGDRDKNTGHYADRDLAIMYLKINDFDKALDHARIEHQRRPQNIDACETLAWCLYKKAGYAEALPLIQTALRTRSQNPERLVRAGLIFIANGKKEEGVALIDKGLALKPYLDASLRQEAEMGRKG